jgi:hypothetical protein
MRILMAKGGATGEAGGPVHGDVYVNDELPGVFSDSTKG